MSVMLRERLAGQRWRGFWGTYLVKQQNEQVATKNDRVGVEREDGEQEWAKRESPG
jgi:hypothetical protein